jgi:hypothetical protein
VNDYMYSTEAILPQDWLTAAWSKWERSSLPFMSFPRLRFLVETLPCEPFWMFMYFSQSTSEDPHWAGKVRYRFHVVDWDSSPYRDSNICLIRYNEPGVMYFKCDRIEELWLEGGGYLVYQHFQHADGINLPSAIRTSIPPVICRAKFKVLRQCPR